MAAWLTDPPIVLRHQPMGNIGQPCVTLTLTAIQLGPTPTCILDVDDPHTAHAVRGRQNSMDNFGEQIVKRLHVKISTKHWSVVNESDVKQTKSISNRPNPLISISAKPLFITKLRGKCYKCFFFEGQTCTVICKKYDRSLNLAAYCEKKWLNDMYPGTVMSPFQRLSFDRCATLKSILWIEAICFR